MVLPRPIHFPETMLDIAHRTQSLRSSPITINFKPRSGICWKWPSLTGDMKPLESCTNIENVTSRQHSRARTTGNPTSRPGGRSCKERWTKWSKRQKIWRYLTCEIPLQSIEFHSPRDEQEL